MIDLGMLPPGFRRIRHPLTGLLGDHGNGVFVTADGLRIIASNGDGWDHVSVSIVDRTPTWEEMSWVHLTFFEPTETAMQLHVPIASHINTHAHCLHLWRPRRGTPIPTPPPVMV